MLIYEEKLEHKYKYLVPEIFGTIILYSSEKIARDILDLLISKIITANANKGSYTLGETIIEYTFEKKQDWEDIDPEKEKEFDEVVKRQKEPKEIKLTKKQRIIRWLIKKLLCII